MSFKVCLTLKSPKIPYAQAIPSLNFARISSLMAQWWRIHLPMQETWVQSLDQEDPLGKDMTTHSSILAWEIPWTEEPGGPQSMGTQRVGHDWARKLHASLWVESDINTLKTPRVKDLFSISSHPWPVCFILSPKFNCLTKTLICEQEILQTLTLQIRLPWSPIPLPTPTTGEINQRAENFQLVGGGGCEVDFPAWWRVGRSGCHRWLGCSRLPAAYLTHTCWA